MISTIALLVLLVSQLPTEPVQAPASEAVADVLPPVVLAQVDRPAPPTRRIHFASNAQVPDAVAAPAAVAPPAAADDCKCAGCKADRDSLRARIEALEAMRGAPGPPLSAAGPGPGPAFGPGQAPVPPGKAAPAPQGAVMPPVAPYYAAPQATYYATTQGYYDGAGACGMATVYRRRPFGRLFGR